jgi:hypothetical protein
MRDPRDQAIDRRVAELHALARRDGYDAVRDRAVVQLTAAVLWLRDAYGDRQTYRVVQAAADQLAAFECR